MKSVLTQRWFKSLVVPVILLLSASSVSATTVIIPTDDDMIMSARVIVRGKVLSVDSAIGDHDRIYTYITLKVKEVIKGHITERKIVIKELGGQVGDQISVIFGNPRFKRGEKVLLYLDTWADGSLRTHQMFLGKFNIERDGATGQQMAVRSSADENVRVLPKSLNKGSRGRSTERMELSAYVAMIRSRLAANLERSQAFEETYYTGVPTLAQPPEYEGVVRNGGFEPQFTLITSSGARWPEPDSGQPVTYTYNPNPAPAPAPQVVVDPNDVAAAANAWSIVSGCSLRLASAGLLNDCYTETLTPGINIVSNNCDGRNSPSTGCASILAWGGYTRARFNPKVVSGQTFQYEITQGFISFNPYASCSFGDHCNVQEITTHELGHALGLGHTADSTATMYAFAHFDGRCASTRTDDQNGIKFIYPGTGGGGPLSVVTASLASGTVGTAYSQSLIASGGTGPYTWSLVAGLGTLPNGLTLSTGGVISGTPSASGNFSFTVQVQDSASAIAQKALSIAVADSTGSPLDAQFVSQTVPTTVQPGAQFSVNMKFRNSGTQTWSGTTFYLVTQNPAFNTTWGGASGANAVSLASYSIAAGQQLDLNFTPTAPITPGTYNFQWQLYQQNGVGFFGQMSANVAIQVATSGGGTNDAAFVSQSAPLSMTAGQTYAVSVTMNNSGTSTWTAAGGYMLGSQNPQDNLTWGLNRVNVPTTVAPGANVTFVFNVTAPSTIGTYSFQWRMLQSGTGFFGLSSTNLVISVGSGGGGGGPYNAQFMTQSVPATMTPGQTYSVSVTMKNTGTSAWTSTGGFKLGSQNPTDNMTWGLNRVSMSKYIGPGSQWTFAFTVRAPSTPGTYNFQWRMLKDTGYFGGVSQNVAVQVGSSGGGGTNGAAFVSQSVPSSMTAGQTYSVSVVMRNTGTTTWTAGAGYKLGSQNPQDNTTWGLNRASLPASIAPGSDATFTFNVVAPSTAGTYNFQWRMIQEGVAYFGAASTNVAVDVTGGGGGGGGTNDAAFVSQTVPSSMTPGQSAAVSVTMTNTGTNTWSAGAGYKLGSQNPQDNTTWGLNRVSLPGSVAPGASVTFTFNVTAPTASGTYNFQWRMIQEGAAYFGTPSTNVAVGVASSGGPPSITTTSLPSGVKNAAYSAQVSATGGTTPYRWSLSGQIPAGLSINPTTGRISGTPTVGGSFYITVTVTDANNLTASRTYKIGIR